MQIGIACCSGFFREGNALLRCPEADFRRKPFGDRYVCGQRLPGAAQHEPRVPVLGETADLERLSGFPDALPEGFLNRVPALPSGGSQRIGKAGEGTARNDVSAAAVPGREENGKTWTRPSLTRRMRERVF